MMIGSVIWLKKIIVSLAVSVILLNLNLAIVQAESSAYSPPKLGQDIFNSDPIQLPPKAKQQTGEEYLINALRGNNPSIWDVVAAEEKMRKNGGFFGYGVNTDYAIVTLMIIGMVAILFYFRHAFRSFGKSTDLARMIQKYNGDYMNPQIVPEIYLYCCKHEFLNPIVSRYKADVGDFASIYLYLLAKCRVSGKGHFIPISTFFFAASLDYVLAKENRLDLEDTLWLRKYFGLL